MASMKGFSLYLHIPYCYHKCPYCDFNTYAVANIPEASYVEGLLSEIDYRASEKNWRGREVQTIFFGGGTPSLFAPSSIRKILSSIERSFPVSENVEISLEANPGTVTVESLAGYREAGVNRLSIGAQSLSIGTLKKIGRMHSPEHILMSVEYARSVGFHNINLDLIYGIEGQTTSDLRSDLQSILALEPEHISAYGLTIEKGTPFFLKYKKGHMTLPSEEIILEMMETISNTLCREGFIHYEISNYAKSGKKARHNLAYWDGEDYLGIGAGAHSFVETNSQAIHRSALRWSNFALPAKYIKEACAHGSASSWEDKLDREKLMFEYFFLGLRKLEGVSQKKFEELFGKKPSELYGITLNILKEQSLIDIDGDNLRLSKKGFFIADSVFEFFLEPENVNLPIVANS
jgi:oxygen-independent coproporphyrinogen III oxidase